MKLSKAKYILHSIKDSKIHQRHAKSTSVFLVTTVLASLTACQPVMLDVKDFGADISSAVLAIGNSETENKSAIPEKSKAQSTNNVVRGQLYQLVIAAGRMPCSSAKPMQCFMVKASPLNNNQQADIIHIQIPYDAISGFSADNSSEYIIHAYPMLVASTKKATGKWQLDKIVEQKYMGGM